MDSKKDIEEKIDEVLDELFSGEDTEMNQLDQRFEDFFAGPEAANQIEKDELLSPDETDYPDYESLRSDKLVDVIFKIDDICTHAVNYLLDAENAFGTKALHLNDVDLAKISYKLSKLTKHEPELLFKILKHDYNKKLKEIHNQAKFDMKELAEEFPYLKGVRDQLLKANNE